MLLNTLYNFMVKIDESSYYHTVAPPTFLRRLLIMNSRARCVAGCGSRGRMCMLLSRGSPGTICQWWKTDMQNAWPWVCVRRSVSKPNESIAGMNALIVYSGEPGTGASWVTWPLQQENSKFNNHLLQFVPWTLLIFYSDVYSKLEKLTKPDFA